jgi:hypothetical protein
MKIKKGELLSDVDSGFAILERGQTVEIVSERGGYFEIDHDDLASSIYILKENVKVI